MQRAEFRLELEQMQAEGTGPWAVPNVNPGAIPVPGIVGGKVPAEQVDEFPHVCTSRSATRWILLTPDYSIMRVKLPQHHPVFGFCSYDLHFKIH